MSWQKALQELKSLGYVLEVKNGLTYSYQGKGDPPREALPLIKTLRLHKKEILEDPGFLNLLIEQTFDEVHKIVTEEVLQWARRNQASKWIQITKLFNRIKQLILDDVRDAEELSGALREYKSFMVKLVDDYRKRDLYSFR
jgi:hypothetical protein